MVYSIVFTLNSFYIYIGYINTPVVYMALKNDICPNIPKKIQKCNCNFYSVCRNFVLQIVIIGLIWPVQILAEPPFVNGTLNWSVLNFLTFIHKNHTETAHFVTYTYQRFKFYGLLVK